MSSSAYDGWQDARKVCVIGAGTMGSGIAAHLANIGFDVSLLDLTKESVTEAFAKAKTARPPHFFLPEKASMVRLGSISDNLDWVHEADWVCEAVVEKMDVKRGLFQAIEPLLRPDAMISTNTSGLQISLLAEGRSESFRRRFLGTHFFNPPRYLKLLELIPTPDTDPKAVRAMTNFLEEGVARRVVVAKDTPGFIANRYGMWAMFHAIHSAERLHLTIEQVDAITGPFLGRPRSASFRLNDIVGLDIMEDIARNLMERCTHDPNRSVLQTPASMATLLQRGWIGEKAGQGYYRREGKELLCLDLQTLAYRQRLEPKLESIEALGKLPLGERIAKALVLRDEAGEYLRTHLVPVLQYADSIKEEISHSVQDFDRVMKWGFAWEMGPFEMIDAIGAAHVNLPGRKYYDNGSMISYAGGFTTIKPEPQFRQLRDYDIMSKCDNFVVRDLGDRVAAISLTTKMGVITPALVGELTHFLEKGKHDRLVLASEGRSFSVGYDLTFFLAAIQAADVKGIDQSLVDLQNLGELLEEQKIVAAVQGHCLGAGLELALSCSHIAALADAQLGLPESKVGLLPGGRGTTLTRLSNQESAKRLADVAMTLTEGIVGANTDQARELGLIRQTDVTVYHPDRLLSDAKKLALSATSSDRPMWKPVEGPLTGIIERLIEDGRTAGRLTEYDEMIGNKIKQVYAKSATYEEALERERTEFLELCFKALTQARIKHMLESGKPLKN